MGGRLMDTLNGVEDQHIESSSLRTDDLYFASIDREKEFARVRLQHGSRDERGHLPEHGSRHEQAEGTDDHVRTPQLLADRLLSRLDLCRSGASHGRCRDHVQTQSDDRVPVRCKTSKTFDNATTDPPPRPSTIQIFITRSTPFLSSSWPVAVLDPLDAEDGISDLPDRSPLPFDDQDFQTVIMIEVHMHPGQNQPLDIMLNMRELVVQVPDMVIIDKGDGPDGLFVLRPFFADQLVPDQVAEGFRSVGVPPAFDMEIKPIEQVPIDGRPEANEFLHPEIGATNC